MRPQLLKSLFVYLFINIIKWVVLILRLYVSYLLRLRPSSLSRDWPDSNNTSEYREDEDLKEQVFVDDGECDILSNLLSISGDEEAKED